MSLARAEIAPGVVRCDLQFVNACFVGNLGEPWAIIDTGMSWHFEMIRAAAAARFGDDARPEAIYLTHGHLDHAGAALALAAYFNVPVYAHRMELPYLTGKADYPPLDSTVGGAFSLMARFLSNKGRDLGEWIHPMPEGKLPGLPGWQVVETPGHTPGHISFFRAKDKVLVGGDAIATVDLDKVQDILVGKTKISKPPAPATTDWLSSRKSVRKLALLQPQVLICGHGEPMLGAALATDLLIFAEHFIVPLAGRYVSDPVQFDENGITFLPPSPKRSQAKVILGLGVVAAIGMTLYCTKKGRFQG